MGSSCIWKNKCKVEKNTQTKINKLISVETFYVKQIFADWNINIFEFKFKLKLNLNCKLGYVTK